MSYRVKQKAIYKIIQPRIIEYICDKCGKITGTKENPKITLTSTEGDIHYCKKICAKEEGWR